MLDWYTRKIPHLLHEFKTDLERGLSTEDANAQQEKHGSNEIRPARKKSLWFIFLKQFFSITVIALVVIIIAIVYPLGAIDKAWVPFSILCFHLFWRFIQDAKTHDKLQTLQRHLEVSSSIIREGAIVKVPPTAIVPGDVLLLNEGDYIPADARIVDAHSLVVDETPLFGTSAPVQKTAEDITEPGLLTEKQRNMVFAGTYILEGSGRAIVVGTGRRLEINNPNRKVPATLDLEPEAEMQMGALYDYFKIAGLILGGLAFVTEWRFQGKDLQEVWVELLFVGLSFVIASIPEGLVSTTQATLANHAHKLFGKGVATCGHRVSLERLSSVTGVCVDEIGKFTQEEVIASHVFVDEQLLQRETWEAWLKARDEAAADEETEGDSIPATPLDAQIPPGFPSLMLLASRCTAAGRNMPRNLAEASRDDVLNQIAEHIGFDLAQYDSTFSKVDELPQTPERPYKTLVFATSQNKFLHLIFGDAEAVLKTCQRIQLHGTIGDMTFDHKQLTQQVIQYLSSQKTQVYGLSYQNRLVPPSQEEMGKNLTFLGLVAFMQLPYTDSKEVIQSGLDAGLKIIMMTNKDRDMASDIAQELGLIQDKNAVATKEDLDGFIAEHYDSIVERLRVYSRPSPEHKLNLVQSLKRYGLSIGFCGKSPKDLRAMRAADVSFASVFRSSHIVQRNAGCLVLKDGFQVIVDALLHARESYSNLRNAMRWLLSCNLAQMLTLLIGFGLHLLYQFPMPLTLYQILWVHTIVNLIPLIALGQDRIRGNLQDNTPQKVHPFLSKAYHLDVLLRSLVIALMTIVSFVVTLQAFGPMTEEAKRQAQTAALTTLIFTQLFSSFQCHRHPWESLFQRIRANIPLFITIFACAGGHLLVIYLPATQQILGVDPLIAEWEWILPFRILMLLPLNLVNRRR